MFNINSEQSPSFLPSVFTQTQKWKRDRKPLEITRTSSKKISQITEELLVSLFQFRNLYLNDADNLKHLTAKEIKSVKACGTTSCHSDWNFMYIHFYQGTLFSPFDLTQMMSHLSLLFVKICQSLITLNYFKPSLQHTHFQLLYIPPKLQGKLSCPLLLKDM